MTIQSTGFPIQREAMNADGGAGGGATGGASNASTGGAVSNGGASTAVAEPSVVEVGDDQLIRVKGSDKPVKFGEHVRGFQAQFTRASQEAARVKAQLAAAQKRISDYDRQRNQVGQSQQQGETEALIGQLKQLPYLSGEQAVQVVQGIGAQLKQRDMVSLALLNQVRQLKGIVDNLNQNHVNGAFDGKINRWIKEGNYPSDIADLMKSVYMGYEGDDLDQEFPAIFKNYWETLNRSITAQREQAARKARESRQFFPGKGGNTGPSSPVQLKGNESPRDLANKLWEQFNESDT